TGHSRRLLRHLARQAHVPFRAHQRLPPRLLEVVRDAVLEPEGLAGVGEHLAEHAGKRLLTAVEAACALARSRGDAVRADALWGTRQTHGARVAAIVGKERAPEAHAALASVAVGVARAAG